MPFETLILAVDDRGLARVTLNRPKKNAMNAALIADLNQAVRLAPFSGLIAEAGVMAPHMIGRKPNRTRQQMRDAFLEDRDGRETNGVAVDVART